MAAEKDNGVEGDKSAATQDDIRARFAGLEDDSNAIRAANDDLPPVPVVSYERPGAKPTRKPSSGSGAANTGSESPLKGFVEARSSLRGSSMALTIGTTLVASIVVGAGLGWLVDHFLLHNPPTPWGLIVGFMIGVAYGFVNLIQVANRINRDDDAEKRSGGGH